MDTAYGGLNNTQTNLRLARLERKIAAHIFPSLRYWLVGQPWIMMLMHDACMICMLDSHVIAKS